MGHAVGILRGARHLPGGVDRGGQHAAAGGEERAEIVGGGVIGPIRGRPEGDDRPAARLLHLADHLPGGVDRGGDAARGELVAGRIDAAIGPGAEGGQGTVQVDGIPDDAPGGVDAERLGVVAAEGAEVVGGRVERGARRGAEGARGPGGDRRESDHLSPLVDTGGGAGRAAEGAEVRDDIEGGARGGGGRRGGHEQGEQQAADEHAHRGRSSHHRIS